MAKDSIKICLIKKPRNKTAWFSFPEARAALSADSIQRCRLRKPLEVFAKVLAKQLGVEIVEIASINFTTGGYKDR